MTIFLNYGVDTGKTFFRPMNRVVHAHRDPLAFKAIQLFPHLPTSADRAQHGVMLPSLLSLHKRSEKGRKSEPLYLAGGTDESDRRLFVVTGCRSRFLFYALRLFQ